MSIFECFYSAHESHKELHKKRIIDIQKKNHSKISAYDFLTGKPNLKGFSIQDFFNLSNAELEYKHDYIQWVFPLNEKSEFNRNAPILTEDECNYIRNSDLARGNITKAFLKMLKFYGFGMNRKGEIAIVNPLNFSKWLTVGNHNYRRITRILKSLTLTGHYYEAKAFYDALSQLYQSQRMLEKEQEGIDHIGSETFAYWTKAINGNRKEI